MPFSEVCSEKKTKQDKGCAETEFLMWNKSYHCVTEPSDIKLHSSCIYKMWWALAFLLKCTGKNPELWKEMKVFQIIYNGEDKDSEISSFYWLDFLKKVKCVRKQIQ